MATDIVSGLFGGITPQMYESRLNEQALAEGQQVGTGAGLYAAGAQLGRAFGSAMGVEDPTLQKIKLQSQILQGLDVTNPNAISGAIEQATQAGIPELAYKLVALRDEATTRAQTQQGLQLGRAAQQLLPQIKNPDGTINEEVKSLLLSFPQGRAAISELAKVIPDLRRIGATGGQEDNPFAVFLNDPTIPANVRTTAQQYANSLKQGILDPEKVDVRVKELSEMTQRAQQFDQNQQQIKDNQATLKTLREQGLENSRQSILIQQGNQELARQNAAFQQDMKRQQEATKAEAAANKPLPSYLAKEEDADYATANAAKNLATDAYGYINKIKSGEILFGLKDLASIRSRQVFGSGASDVVAREDYDKFVINLVNESLRLNKGTQTEGDAVRAANELKSSESKEAAAAAMKRLLQINIRRTESAAKSVETRRVNNNFPVPPRPIEIPQFDVQIITPADYNSFLKNPKYPSGTVFVDPDGVRRTKP